MAHQEFGIRLLERVRNDLEPYGIVEQFPKMEGRQMIMVLGAKKGKKKEDKKDEKKEVRKEPRARGSTSVSGPGGRWAERLVTPPARVGKTSGAVVLKRSSRSHPALDRSGESRSSKDLQGACPLFNTYQE